MGDECFTACTYLKDKLKRMYPNYHPGAACIAIGVQDAIRNSLEIFASRQKFILDVTNTDAIERAILEARHQDVGAIYFSNLSKLPEMISLPENETNDYICYYAIKQMIV